MGRETRNLQNSKQNKISDISYYPTEMAEGETLFAFPKSKLLRLYKKIRGIVWWLPFTKDGNYIFEGNVKIGGNVTISKDIITDGVVDGVDVSAHYHTQKAHLLFGYNADISATEDTATEWAKTVDGVNNGYGYRMMRSGNITGISVVYTCSALGGESEYTLTVYKNNTDATAVVATGSISTIAVGKGGSTVANSFSFVANDTINVEIHVVNDTGGVTVTDFAIVLEVQYDSSVPV